MEAVHAASYAVRRLLPLECERLQGFEDEYTLVPVHSARHRERCEHYDSESPALRVIVAAGVTALPCCGAKVTMKPAADAPRYKALGNSFAVNVVRWIGQRIQMVEDAMKAEDAAHPAA